MSRYKMNNSFLSSVNCLLKVIAFGNGSLEVVCPLSIVNMSLHCDIKQRFRTSGPWLRALTGVGGIANGEINTTCVGDNHHRTIATAEANSAGQSIVT